MSGRPQLGYWKLRGYAQPIRYLLKYTGTDFEDVRYEFGPDGSRDQWLSVKETMGFDFPNLPYYIDGNVKLTQSNAIMRYIARKNGLCGKTDQQLAVVDVLENEIIDLRMGYGRLVYNAAMESMKAEYFVEVKAKLQRLSTFLGSKHWLVGDQITYPDFLFYEVLKVHRELEPTILDEFSNLKEYLDRFEALPAIKDYQQSSEFLNRPINGPTAAWGNS